MILTLALSCTAENLLVICTMYVSALRQALYVQSRWGLVKAL